jgi:hypothetical protein
MSKKRVGEGKGERRRGGERKGEEEKERRGRREWKV